MDKYFLLSGKEASGAPRTHLIEPGTRYGLGETASLLKTASGEHLPEVMRLVESIAPQPDRLYLLNSALGAGEYVGHNMRGDWFNEAGLRHTPAGWDKIAVEDIDARRRAANQTENVDGWGDLAWGFPTFMNAHRFRHHINKDPNRAYGFVLGSFWDDRMKRVILVTELIRELCEALGALDVYDRIAAGEFPDTSMGTRVPFDVCSICGHKARTPAEYCRHVSKTASAPYGMGALLPDGRRCGVENPYPRFFDDSLVFVGAEKSAKVMTDLTNRVRGTRGYTQTIYPFGETGKLASAPEPVSALQDVPLHPQEQEQRLARAVSSARREMTPKTDGSSGAALTRVLETLRPASTAEEREILRLLSVRPGGDKSASAKKWAEMLKQLPAPDANQRAIVRHHAGRLRQMTKEEVRSFGDDPATALSKAAEFGVVFTPEEFQFAMLRPFAPKTAEMLWDTGRVFAPAPIPVDDRSVDFCPLRTNSTKVAEAASRLFWERSIAPQAVAHRIASDGVLGEVTLKHAAHVHYPGSSVMAELYNDYRGGLLAHPPDWRYATGGPRDQSYPETEAKIASAARNLSGGLLTLAYWPGLDIG